MCSFQFIFTYFCAHSASERAIRESKKSFLIGKMLWIHMLCEGKSAEVRIYIYRRVECKQNHKSKALLHPRTATKNSVHCALKLLCSIFTATSIRFDFFSYLFFVHFFSWQSEQFILSSAFIFPVERSLRFAFWESKQSLHYTDYLLAPIFTPFLVVLIWLFLLTRKIVHTYRIDCACKIW